MACQKLALKRCRDGFGNMLILAFTHHPFICHPYIFTFLMFDLSLRTVLSSVTTTLELKTGLLESDLDNHSPYEILSPW